jgi:hypothetical protein
MKGWIRLAVVLSVFWLIGCGVVLLVELSQLPQSRDCAADRPAFAAFFQSTKISAVHIRHPQLDIVAFPSSMTRPEIEDALRRNLPKFYEPTNAPIEWDVPVDKPTDYYRIAFDGFFRITIFPAVAIFTAVLAVGCGTRWVVQGFKT